MTQKEATLLQHTIQILVVTKQTTESMGTAIEIVTFEAPFIPLLKRLIVSRIQNPSIPPKS
jgi:hypothetical protein